LRLAAAIVCLSFLAPSALAKSERDKTKSKLRRGEIVVKTGEKKGSKYPTILAMALIDVKPSQLWSVISDCRTYKDNLPSTVSSDRLKRWGDKKERCKIVISVPLLPNLTAVTDSVMSVEPDKKYVRAWKLLKGDYKKNAGSWTLMPFEGPDRTLVVYKAHVEPKMDVPPKIQKMAIRNSLPQLFKKLRRKMAEKFPKK